MQLQDIKITPTMILGGAKRRNKYYEQSRRTPMRVFMSSNDLEMLDKIRMDHIQQSDEGLTALTRSVVAYDIIHSFLRKIEAAGDDKEKLAELYEVFAEE